MEPILDTICRRLKDQHEIILKIDSEVEEMLADKGYKPEFGARELRRVVERELEMKLAEKLIAVGSKRVKNWKAVLCDETIGIAGT